MQLRNFFVAATLLSASFVARAATVDFDFTFAGTSNNGSGTFITSTTGTAGQYLVTGVINGTANGSAISLLPAGTFPSAFPPLNDNFLFYPASGTQPYVDAAGIAVKNAAGLYIILFSLPGGYLADTSTDPSGNPGISETISLMVTPTGVAATPEPGTFALLGTGALGLAGIVRRRFAQA